MAKWTELVCLRIWASEDDTLDTRPLHEVILRSAREAGLAGATVIRGIASYGHSRHIHETWRGFSYDLGVLVEIVDSEAKIDAWLPVLEEMRQGCLVTRTRTEVLEPYGASAAR